MKFSKSFFAVTASWSARFSSLLVQLVFLPFLLNFLDVDQAGLWILLFQANAVVSLLEFGFGAAFSRSVAFRLAEGAADVSDILQTGKLTIFLISVLALAVSAPVGAFSIEKMSEAPASDVTIAWFILCVANALRISQSYSRATLNAFGHVGWDSIVSIASQFILVVLQISFLVSGGGLIALAVGFLVSVVINKIALAVVVAKLIQKTGKGKFDPKFILENWRLMFGGWLTGIGAYLLLKTDYFLVGYFAGLGEVSSFFAANQIVQNIHILAIALTITSSPFISRAFRIQNYMSLHKLVYNGAQFAFVTWAFALTFLLVNGEIFFTAWLGAGAYVGLPLLLLIIMASFLETGHMVVTGASRATGLETFYKASLIAASINIFLSILLGSMFGVFGIVSATIIAQLSTNVWIAYTVGLERLRLPLNMFLSNIMPIFLFSGACNFVALTLSRNMSSFGNFGNLIVALCVSGSLFAAFVIYIIRQTNWSKTQSEIKG